MAMTVDIPEALAERLAAEAARLGVEPDHLAVEALENVYGVTASVDTAAAGDALDAFIGCGSSGIEEPFDIHAARADLAARKLAEGA